MACIAALGSVILVKTQVCLRESHSYMGPIANLAVRRRVFGAAINTPKTVVDFR